MAYLTMPISSDEPSYDFQVPLEGTVYSLGFSYNSRSNRWSMDIMDEVENPLIMGIVLVAGVVLNTRFVEAAGPAGSFYLYDTQGGGADPGRDDLGNRFQLFYRESTTPSGQ
jgi:hypothetical protein